MCKELVVTPVLRCLDCDSKIISMWKHPYHRCSNPLCEHSKEWEAHESSTNIYLLHWVYISCREDDGVWMESRNGVLVKCEEDKE